MQNRDPRKKLYIETLGCAMNVRDSEHIVAELHDQYTLTQDASSADLIIINTCSVREKPVQKLFSEIGKFAKAKKEDTKIGVCGCTASHLGKQIFKRAPSVDFVLGARNVSKIAQAVKEKGFVAVDIDHDETAYEFSDSYQATPFKKLINISIGCDKKCTFCIVPNTRGEEISIPLEMIQKEIEKAVAKGAKEVMLLGQNVNNYGRRFSTSHEKIDFTTLLQEISKIDGLQRIRFASPHPLHMDDAFIEEFANNPKICKFIHIPLQSGSTKILQDMKRGYSKEWFLNRVAKIKELVPHVTVGTDIIVGFPGESEEDFEDTMDVVKQVGFDQIFSFKYSPRPLTPAKDYENQVDESVAAKRLEQLQSLAKEILDKKMEAEVGTVHEVYFEHLQKSGLVAGRSDTGRLVTLKGSEELLGKLKDVKITKAHRMSLEGELL
ncbi:MAG: tRNA (N6-isopentenyl adenosine(37)-C2)-methylthiotransferase MiaB [Campylobacterota bacterium]